MVAHITGDSRLPTLIPCVQCGQEFTVYVSSQDMRDWLAGSGYIQDLMPYLSPAERELLISGTCGPCFDSMFSLDMDDDIE